MDKEVMEKEISEMAEEYRRVFNGRCAFLTGSSLCGNLQGDSARYWELKNKLNKMNRNKGYVFDELPLVPLDLNDRSKWIGKRMKVKFDIQNRKLEYLKFLICFILTPTTATTILLMPYLNPYLAYLLACIFWGTILYFVNDKK